MKSPTQRSLLVRAAKVGAKSATTALYASWVCVLAVLSGCSGGSDSDNLHYVTLGTAPTGGAFAQVGGVLAEVLNANKGTVNWSVQAQGSKGSQENIRNLDKGSFEFAMSNAAITYFAVRGEAGWDKKYNVKAVMTLAPNVAMFVTPESSGVKTIADLKGERVVVGPSGAGFRMFLEPILKAHGVTYDDFTALHQGQSDAVGLLADGNAAAAFLGGAVPTGSITQACSTQDIHFIPFADAAKASLITDYPFFKPAVVTADKYSDLKEDFHGLNVGSMHVITRGDLNEEVVFEFTKQIYNNRAAVITGHPAGKAIEKFAALDTGVEFHPGAIRFYKSIGMWIEAGGNAND